MGVVATFCCVCAMPVQHDHYVPSADGDLKIYRSPDAHWEEGEKPFPFRPEHAWLRDAVALSRHQGGPATCGTVTDGTLEPKQGEALFVWDGSEDHFVLHQACWERAGMPEAPDSIPDAYGTHAWATLAPYQEQLFEFAELASDGKGWMLVDPRGSSADASRNRARIDAAIAAGRQVQAGEAPATVHAVLSLDRGWKGLALRNDDHRRHDVVRMRANLTNLDLDIAQYPALVFLMKEYGGDETGMPDAATLQRLEEFELALKTAVEADDRAVLGGVTIGQGQVQYIIQARDEAETRARIDALPNRDVPPGEYDNEHDPDWNVLFQQFIPTIARAR